jgi:hypothetical protein
MKFYTITFIFFTTWTNLVGQNDINFQSISGNWVQDYNRDASKDLLTKYYLDAAGLFIEGKMIQNSAAIASALHELKAETGKIISFQSLGIHRQNDTRYFEMGQYISNSPDVFLIGIIAWNKQGDQWKKELEILYKNQEFDVFDVNGIDEAREKWVELSNAHNHQNLVNEVYTRDAIYFHKAIISKGTQNIVPRYAYMSNPKWSITLESLQQIPVNNNLVLEVGKYTSSGIGLYILIWQRTIDKWQALFDFNF